jgi:hypothetical protein
MNYRSFGRTGWQVGEMGYGMWGMAGWTGSDDDQSLRALDLAVELGCNFFDTAWAYGDGHSERLLGQARVVEPFVFPSVKLDEIKRVDADVREAFFDVFDDILGRETIVERKFAAAGPAAIFRRNFCGDIKFFVGACGGSSFVGAKNSAEKLFAMAVAVGPSGVEKIAAEIDGTLERRKRFRIFRAGPAGHAPHTITNFADVPSGAAESAVMHDVLSLR